MFGIASRVRSFLGYSGTDNSDYDEYEYETVSDTSEEDPLEGTDEEEETMEIASAPENVLDIESVSDITGIGTTRASQLDSAGFVTPADVYFADDEDLADVDGIGPYTVDQIRGDLGSPSE